MRYSLPPFFRSLKLRFYTLIITANKKQLAGIITVIVVVLSSVAVLAYQHRHRAPVTPSMPQVAKKIAQTPEKSKDNAQSTSPPKPTQSPAAKPPAPGPVESPTAPPSRVNSDQADDTSANQIHVMYVLPSDGEDRSYDTNGQIAASVGGWRNWLSGQTGGRTLRLDTYHGSPDISFFRLTQTDAQIKNSGSYVRDQIESELKSAGYNKANKIYAVYYDGGSNYACGGGAWPPTLPGNVAALYLKGAYNGVNCDSNHFSSGFGYRESSMIHEILHTLGFVASCAPNFTQSGHVSDDPHDLMYAGSLPWQPSILDTNHDDYYGHNNQGCLDLATSPYLQ